MELSKILNGSGTMSSNPSTAIRGGEGLRNQETQAKEDKGLAYSEGAGLQPSSATDEQDCCQPGYQHCLNVSTEVDLSAFEQQRSSDGHITASSFQSSKSINSQNRGSRCFEGGNEWILLPFRRPSEANIHPNPCVVSSAARPSTTGATFHRFAAQTLSRLDDSQQKLGAPNSKIAGSDRMPLSGFNPKHFETANTSQSLPDRLRKRKHRANFTSIEERQIALEGDHWVSDFGSDNVVCKGCSQRIKTDDRRSNGQFYSGLWERHRAKCRQIRLMFIIHCWVNRDSVDGAWPPPADQYWLSVRPGRPTFSSSSQIPWQYLPVWLRLGRGAAASMYNARYQGWKAFWNNVPLNIENIFHDGKYNPQWHIERGVRGIDVVSLTKFNSYHDLDC